MKGKLSNEPVNVVGYSVTYEVQDEHLQTSIPGYEIRELNEEPDSIDDQISVTFGPAVSKASATKALQMVLDRIETEGLPSLVTKMERRAATRLVKLQKDAAKASKLLTKVPDEVRADIKRMLAFEI